MQLAILSDTHDNSQGVDWVINYLNQRQITIALHAGDLVQEHILQQFINNYQGYLHFVFGNNQRQPDQMIQLSAQADNITCHEYTMDTKIEGKSIFMNHYSHISIQYAQTGEYDLCIGGHDHLYQAQKYGHTLFINPGNVTADDSQPRNRVSSIVILDFNNFNHEQVIVPKHYE